MRWLLALSCLLTLCGFVVGREGFAENVTSSANRAFEMTDTMKKFLEDIRDGKEITKREAKFGDKIENYADWSFFPKGEKLDKDKFDPSIKRLERMSSMEEETHISCNTLQWKEVKVGGDEKDGDIDRWIDTETGRVITENPHDTCNGASEGFVIDSQQPGGKINQLFLCPRFLAKYHAQSALDCDKWCLKEIAAVLKLAKEITQTPIDISDKLTGTIFFQLLFTTGKDTIVKACKPKGKKNKRAEEQKDNLNIHAWADVNKYVTWATTQFVRWATIMKDLADGNKDLGGQGRTYLNRPSAITLCAKAMFLHKKNDQETLKTGVLVMA